MQKNVGSLDAYFRITLGLFGLAWGTSQLVKRPYSGLPIVVSLASAIKVAEGVTRFCPMLALFNVNTIMQEDERKGPYTTSNYARRKVENLPTQPQEERKANYE